MGTALVAVLLAVVGSGCATQTPIQEEGQQEQANVESTQKKRVSVPLPEEVRGFYWHAGTVGDPERRKKLMDYALERGLNTVVLDINFDNGAPAFDDGNELEDVLAELAEQDLYRIVRIPVMRNSFYAKSYPSEALLNRDGGLWRDNTGARWLDPASAQVTQDAIDRAIRAYERGFDEIQFDYVRFPSDGVLSSISYPRWKFNEQTRVEVMQQFFETVGSAMREREIPVSFDLFGMTYVNPNDFNIGQRLQDVYPYADFISPMVYPSHYPSGFIGINAPALSPYRVIHHSLEEGKKMLEPLGITPEELSAKTRPWIQDFDIGALYTAELIEAQIQAVRDAGGSGWILWNARNVYEPAAYKKTHD